MKKLIVFIYLVFMINSANGDMTNALGNALFKSWTTKGDILLFDEKNKTVYNYSKELLYLGNQDIKKDVDLDGAINYCENLELYGLKDWVLPSNKQHFNYLENSDYNSFIEQDAIYWVDQNYKVNGKESTDLYYQKQSDNARASMNRSTIIVNPSFENQEKENSSKSDKTNAQEKVNEVCSNPSSYSYDLSDGLRYRCSTKLYSAMCIHSVSFDKLPLVIKKEVQPQYNKLVEEAKKEEVAKKKFFDKAKKYQQKIKKGTLCFNNKKVLELFDNDIKVVGMESVKRFGRYGRYEYVEELVEKWISKSKCFPNDTTWGEYTKYILLPSASR